LAWELLVAKRIRPVIAIVGVAVSVVLIVVVIALYRGWQDAGSALVRLPGEVWVVQLGSSNLFDSVSQIDDDVVQGVGDHPDVARAVPSVGRPITFFHRDSGNTAFFFAFEPSGLAALEPAERTKYAAAPGTAIIDESLRRRYGVQIGDRITVNTVTLDIAAETEGGNAVFQQFAYLNWGDARDALAPLTGVSYLMLDPVEGVSPSELARSIQAAYPNVTVLTSGELADVISAEVGELGLPMVGMILLLGAGVSSVMVSLTMYTLILEHTKTFAVLKAIGAEPALLARVVLQQSLSLSVTGAMIGIFAGLGVAELARQEIVVFATQVQALDMLAVFGGAVLLALVAALIPLRQLVHTDPAAVFRA
jgi:putative ABC transport system permease protein